MTATAETANRPDLMLWLVDAALCRAWLDAEVAPGITEVHSTFAHSSTVARLVDAGIDHARSLLGRKDCAAPTDVRTIHAAKRRGKVRVIKMLDGRTLQAVPSRHGWFLSMIEP